MKPTLQKTLLWVLGFVLGSTLTSYLHGDPTDHLPGSTSLGSEVMSALRRDLFSSATRFDFHRNINTSQVDFETFDFRAGESNVGSFVDGYAHHDDSRVAQLLATKVRVLCWVMTCASNLQKKAVHVKATWARRCNHVVFISDEDDPDFPAYGVGTESGREHLTAKTMRAFDFIYQNYYDRADWFLKADDDTYVIVENLRYLLSAHDPTDPIFFGHHFKPFVRQGYFSGGAGYVISKEALRRYGTRPPGVCATDSGPEDVQMGRCMERLDVLPGDSRDAMGRTRFHCFYPGKHILGMFPQWYTQYGKYEAKKGIRSISDYPISFHYVSVDLMYTMEYYVYHIGAYGITRGLQDINGPVMEEGEEEGEGQEEEEGEEGLS